MKYHIRQDAGKPAYLQLYEQLRRDIVEGVLPLSAKLPSKRLLAEETGVSVITVEHAYAILCDEGYIEARQRSGYYVIYRERDFLTGSEAAVVTAPGAGPLRTDREEFPFPQIARTMRKVLADYGENILVKSHDHGCVQLRMAIAAYLARSCGISALPEQIRERTFSVSQESTSTFTPVVCSYFSARGRTIPMEVTIRSPSPLSAVFLASRMPSSK